MVDGLFGESKDSQDNSSASAIRAENSIGLKYTTFGETYKSFTVVTSYPLVDNVPYRVDCFYSVSNRRVLKLRGSDLTALIEDCHTQLDAIEDKLNSKAREYRLRQHAECDTRAKQRTLCRDKERELKSLLFEADDGFSFGRVEVLPDNSPVVVVRTKDNARSRRKKIRAEISFVDTMDSLKSFGFNNSILAGDKAILEAFGVSGLVAYLPQLAFLHDTLLMARSLYYAREFADVLLVVRSFSKFQTNLAESYTIAFGLNTLIQSMRKKHTIEAEGFFSNMHTSFELKKPSEILAWIVDAFAGVVESDFALMMREMLVCVFSLQSLGHIPKIFGKEVQQQAGILKSDLKVSKIDLLISVLKSMLSISASIEQAIEGVLPSTFFHRKNIVVECLAKVPLLVAQSEMLYIGLPVEGYVDVPSWFKEAKEVYDILEKASAKATPFSKKGPEILKSKMILGKALSDVRSRVASQRRIPPVGVILESFPGVGKSGILSLICAVFSKVKGRVHSDTLIYHRNMSSQYMESLQAMSQPYYHYSELGKWAASVAASRPDVGIEEFLSLCDSQPMEVNKAFGDKGKSFAAPELVIADTNNHSFHVDKLCHAPAAFYRRFLFVSVSVKSQYRKEDSCEIDPAKCNDGSDLLDRWNFSVYKHHAMNNKLPSPPKYMCQDVDIHDFVDCLANMFVKHIEHNTKFEEDLAVALETLPYGKFRKQAEEEDYEQKFSLRTKELAASIATDLTEYEDIIKDGKSFFNSIDEEYEELMGLKDLEAVESKDFVMEEKEVPSHIVTEMKRECDGKCEPCLLHHEHTFSCLSECCQDCKALFLRNRDYTQKMTQCISQAPEVSYSEEALKLEISRLNEEKKKRSTWAYKLKEWYKSGEQQYVVSTGVSKLFTSRFGDLLASGFSLLKNEVVFQIASKRYKKIRWYVDLSFWLILIAFCISLLYVWNSSLARLMFFMSICAFIVHQQAFNIVEREFSQIAKSRDTSWHNAKFSWYNISLLFGGSYTGPDGTVVSEPFETRETFKIFLTVSSTLAFLLLVKKLISLVPRKPTTIDPPVDAVPVDEVEEGEEKIASIDTEFAPKAVSKNVSSLLHAGGQLFAIPINGAVDQWEKKNVMMPNVSFKHTGDATGLIPIIQRNTRKANIYKDGQYIGYMHLFGILGDVAVIPKHAFDKIPDTGDIIMRSPNDGMDEKESGYKEMRLKKSDVVLYGEELCMFHCGSQFRFTDVTKHLNDDVLTFKTAVKCIIGSEVVHAQYSTIPREYGSGDSSWIISSYYTYYWPEHATGTCGAPLIAQFGNVAGILGIHFGSDNMSYACPISRSMVKDFVSKKLNGKLSVIASEGFKPNTLPVINPKSPWCHESFPIIHQGMMPGLDGLKPAPVMIPKNSKLQPSMMHKRTASILDDFFGKQTAFYGAPTMKPYTNAKGEWISAYNKGLRKMSNSRVAIDRGLMNVVLEKFVSHVVSSLKVEGIALKPYGIDFAINGDPQNPNFRRINASTSAGHGFKGVKGDHMPLAESKDEWSVFRQASPQLIDAVSHMLTEWDAGRTCSPIYNVALKDEPRLIEKCLNGSTRLFYVQPLDQVVSMRMLFGSFFSLFPSHQDLFHCAVGIDMHRDADALYKKFLNFGGKCGDFDYEGFDVSSSPDVAWLAASCIIEIMMQLGYPEEYRTTLESCFTDIFEPQLNMNSEVFSVPGLQPSGMYATAELNSLKNTLMLMLFWYSQEDLKDKNFFDDLFHYTYGDDVFYRVKDACSTSFDNVKYAAFCKSVLGMTVTTASKSKEMPQFTPLNDITFLKRSFTWRADLNRYVAQLDKDSIRKSLDWFLPSSVPHSEQMLSTMRSALYELFLHLDEKQYHDVRSRLITQYCDESGLLGDSAFKSKISGSLPTFHEIKTAICGNTPISPLLED